MAITTKDILGHGVGFIQASEVSAADGQTSEVVRVNNWPCAAALNLAGGSGYLEYTLSLPSHIAAGTARWHTWAAGTVVESTVDYPPAPITGIRAVSVSGAVVLEVVQ